jgi:hypothetical protein
MRFGTLSRAESYFQLKVTIASIEKAESTLAFKKNMSLDSRIPRYFFPERSRKLRRVPICFAVHQRPVDWPF